MNKLKSLKDYTDELDKAGASFPLMIMGQKTSSSYHTATMLADMYGKTENPDTRGVPAQAPFGEIFKRGTVLNPVTTFSKVVAPKNGLNLFQGDVLSFNVLESQRRL